MACAARAAHLVAEACLIRSREAGSWVQRLAEALGQEAGPRVILSVGAVRFEAAGARVVARACARGGSIDGVRPPRAPWPLDSAAVERGHSEPRLELEAMRFTRAHEHVGRCRVGEGVSLSGTGVRVVCATWVPATPRALMVQAEEIEASERGAHVEASGRASFDALGELLVASLPAVCRVFAHRVARLEEHRGVLMGRISPMQRRVASLLVRGLTEPEIAQRLERSRHTIHDHTKAIYGQWGVSTRIEMIGLWNEPDVSVRGVGRE